MSNANIEGGGSINNYYNNYNILPAMLIESVEKKSMNFSGKSKPYIHISLYFREPRSKTIHMFVL